jgi:hypothetical protein
MYNRRRVEGHAQHPIMCDGGRDFAPTGKQITLTLTKCLHQDSWNLCDLSHLRERDFANPKANVAAAPKVLIDRVVI